MSAADERDEPLDERTRTFIGNVKYAHARRLLARLRDVDMSDTSLWFHYLVLLLIKMRPEFERLRTDHPDLGEVFDQCSAAHREQLAPLLDEHKR